MILRTFQKRCLKVLLAGYPPWVDLTCSLLGVPSDSGPQKGREWGLGVPDSTSTSGRSKGRAPSHGDFSYLSWAAWVEKGG